MRIFSHPFRLLASGKIATVDQGSDAGNAEAVAQIVLTRVDERPLVPSFGIPDPTFHTVTEHDVVAAVVTFLPEVTIAKVTVEDIANRAQQVHVELGDASAQP